MLVALTFAVGAAVGYGLASVLQAVGARRVAGTLNTLRDPLYLTGLALDLLAWLASLVALRTLPVYQVQATVAGSLAVTVLAARVLLAARLRRAEVAAVGVTVVALVALAASAGVQHAARLTGAGRWGLALTVVPVALAGYQAVRRLAPGAAAVAAGLAFGGAALSARALTVPAGPLRHVPATLHTLAAEPLGWALPAYGIAGMLLYAWSLEHGGLGQVTALLWIAEVSLPSVVGIVLLGDAVRPGWAPTVAAALVAALTAAWVLARAPAADPATPSPATDTATPP